MSRNNGTIANLYLIVCGNSTHIIEGSILEALNLVSEKCASTERAEVYRAKLVAVLDKEDIAALTAKARRAAESEKDLTAVVFDQMFKGFAEVVDREVKDEPVIFHEIVGRGVEKTIKYANRIYFEPARDDYDVLSLLERLANKYKLVLFFTGDKKLASQARLIPGVQVEYLPPSEVAGKEQAIKLIIKRIKSLRGTVQKAQE